MDVEENNECEELMKTQTKPIKRKMKPPNVTAKKFKRLHENTFPVDQMTSDNNKKYHPSNLKKVKGALKSKAEILHSEEISKENLQLANERKINSNPAQKEDSEMHKSKQVHFEKNLTEDKEPADIPVHVKKMLDEAFFDDDTNEKENVNNDQTTNFKAKSFKNPQKVPSSEELKCDFSLKDNITTELAYNNKPRFSSQGKYEETNSENSHIKSDEFTEDPKEDSNFDTKHGNLKAPSEEKTDCQEEKEEIKHSKLQISTINNSSSLNDAVRDVNDEIERSKNIINYLKGNKNTAQGAATETTDLPISNKTCMTLLSERREQAENGICSNMKVTDASCVVVQTNTEFENNTRKGIQVEEVVHSISHTKPISKNDKVTGNKTEPHVTKNSLSSRAQFKNSWKPPILKSRTEDAEPKQEMNVKHKGGKLTIFHISALEYEAAYPKDRNEFQVKDDTSDYDETDINTNGKTAEESLNKGLSEAKDIADLKNPLNANELDVIKSINFPQFDNGTQICHEIRLSTKNENTKLTSFENTEESVMNKNETLNGNGLESTEKIKSSQTDLCNEEGIKLGEKEEIPTVLHFKNTGDVFKNGKCTEIENDLNGIGKIKSSQFDGYAEFYNEEKIKIIEKGEISEVLSFENIENDSKNEKCTLNENDFDAIEKLKFSQFADYTELYNEDKIKMMVNRKILKVLNFKSTENDLKNEKGTQNKNDLETIEKIKYSLFDENTELYDKEMIKLKGKEDIPIASHFENAEDDLKVKKCIENKNLGETADVEFSQFDASTKLNDKCSKLKENNVEIPKASKFENDLRDEKCILKLSEEEQLIKELEKEDIHIALDFKNDEDNVKVEKRTQNENLGETTVAKFPQFDDSTKLSDKGSKLKENNEENPKASKFGNDLMEEKCISKPSEEEQSVKSKCKDSIEEEKSKNSFLDIPDESDVSSSQKDENGSAKKQSTNVDLKIDSELKENANVSECSAEMKFSESFLITAKDFFSKESCSSAKSSTSETTSSPSVNEEVQKTIIPSDQDYGFDLDDDFSLTASQLNMIEKNENDQMDVLNKVKNASQQTEYCDNTHFGFDSITVEVIDQLCYLRESVESIKELLQKHFKKSNTEE